MRINTFEGFSEEQLSGIEKETEKDFFRIRFADTTIWSVVAKQVKAAVEQYEREFHRLVKVPISDRAGTLVITK